MFSRQAGVLMAQIVVKKTGFSGGGGRELGDCVDVKHTCARVKSPRGGHKLSGPEGGHKKIFQGGVRGGVRAKAGLGI